MERSLMNRIRDWYNNGEKRLLIVAGAGGVGKTWLIEQFCGRQSLECIRLDMNEKVCENPCQREGEKIIFADNVNSKEQLENLANMLLRQKDDKCIEGWRIIIAGRPVSENDYRDMFMDIFPDEKMTYLRLYPLSLREFAKALSGAYEMDIYSTLKIYMIVGGMPECVSLFLEDGDLTRIREKQRAITDNIHYTIGCSDIRLLKRCHEVIKSLNLQSWDGAGFTLRKVNPNAREREYGVAIRLLEEYGIVSKIKRFDGNEVTGNRSYKLQLLDIGLYGALSEIDERTIYDEEKLFHKTLVTALVVQELIAYGINESWQICYWKGYRIKAKLPVVLTGKNRLVPLELMAKENILSKSMNSFLEKYDVSGVMSVLHPIRRKKQGIQTQGNTYHKLTELYELESICKNLFNHF